MAKTYYTIQNFTAGAILTAAQMNTIGTTVNSSTVRPICINQRTGQSISDSTLTAIAFTSAASVDTDSMHSTATNNTRFTAQTAGVYQVCGSIDVTAGGTIDVVGYAALRANGSTNFCNASIVSNGYVQQVSLSAIVNLAASGYVELTFYQDNTGNTARTVTGSMQAAFLGKATAP